MTGVLRVAALQAFRFQVPCEIPVRTSFGTMRDRPALLVRVQDEDGVVGWGEAWCNFPPGGAEHRQRLLRTVLAPLVVGRSFPSPADAFNDLTEKTAVIALQSGERGPFAQCIAAIDIAMWDLAARRSRMPLWRLLGGANPSLSVYASGINPETPARVALEQSGRGHRAFKLKVAFGRERDLENLEAIRMAIGDRAALMVDANQGWTADEARRMLREFEPFSLRWIEEPLRADVPWSVWQSLADATSVPIAAGENLASEAEFDAAMKSNAITVVQPDVAKWGGFSACLPLGRRIAAGGLSFCPHTLGGGIALLASAHLLAAVGGKGMLEMDSNRNPLRSQLCGSLASVEDGQCMLSEAPGLGIEPDLRSLERYAARGPE